MKTKRVCSFGLFPFWLKCLSLKLQTAPLRHHVSQVSDDLITLSLSLCVSTGLTLALIAWTSLLTRPSPCCTRSWWPLSRKRARSVWSSLEQRETHLEIHRSSPQRDVENKTNILKRQLTLLVENSAVFLFRPAFRHSARRLGSDPPPLSLVKANTFWRRGGESEGSLKSCTVSCFHGCSSSHMCALSLQLMALFTGFLAPPPPPPTCTSETAALEPRRSLLPLWTSKLCPFCTGAATLWTLVHTHESPLHRTHTDMRHFVFIDGADQCFPSDFFLSALNDETF